MTAPNLISVATGSATNAIGGVTFAPEVLTAGGPQGLAQYATGADGSRLPSFLRDNDTRANWWRHSNPDVAQPIDALRWNKHFPYELRVVRKNGDGYEWVDDWKFVLPCPPESLSISMSVPTEMRATLEGVVIEPGGAPFRQISLSGNTGVMLLRPTTALSGAAALISGVTQFIPGRAVEALATEADRFLSAAGAFLPQINQIPADVLSGASGPVLLSTGYYQFRLMQLFLERYVAIRDSAEGKQYRLAFCAWKDESIYLVEPQTFDMSRGGGGVGPLGYNYRLGLKGWRRVSGVGVGVFGKKDAGFEWLNAIPAIFGAIEAAQVLWNGYLNVVGGVIADVATVSGVFGELGLLGTPDSKLSSFSQGTVESLYGAIFEFQDAVQVPGPRVGVDLAKAGNSQQEASVGSNGGSRQVSGLTAADPKLKAQALAKALENPQKAFEILSQIRVSDLRLSAPQRQAVADEVARVRSLGRREWQERRKTLEATEAAYSDAVGLGGGAILALTQGRTPGVQVREATEEDHQALGALRQAILAIDAILVNLPKPQGSLAAVDIVAGLASQAGVAFQTPVSKFAVPFPYGSDLERLAQRYLGDPDRWHEIATLNGLRSPWVDETGYELPLTTDGLNNTVVVADVRQLQVGQRVSLIASDTPQTRRVVRGLERLSNGFYEVLLDGDSDLGAFRVASGASLHAFLPGTVNSQQQLFIPSPTAANPELMTRDVPGLESFQTILDRGGTDLMLTADGDLVLTPDGDTPYAVGMANIIQRVRILLRTPRGSILRHPEFGLAVRPGTSTADVNAAELLQATRAALASDPDFASVEFAAVQKNGPVLSQQIHVSVAGVDQLIPVSTDILL